MRTLQAADLDLFQSLIERRLGLYFDEGKREFLADVLRQRLQAQEHLSAAAYLASLSNGANGREELRVLAGRLTVCETYFFRGADQFNALADALGERIRAHASERRLRLLSAGCASGEEPYSLAILLRERFPELGAWKVEILGLDINRAMIAKARQGRYDKWSLRDAGDEMRERYFRNEGGEYALEQDTRSMVRFEELNLVEGDLFSLGEFDVIFCRNVLMYLAPEAMRAVVALLTRALAPGGFLFLGYAETLRGLSHDFHLRQSNKAFYYQKRLAAGETPAGFSEGREARPSSERPPGPLDAAWMDSIRMASQSIVRLSRDGAARAASSPQSRRNASADLGAISELLRQEKFREALHVLGGAGPLDARDPDNALLRAGLLANCGEAEAAESICRQILSHDDLNAAAHYLAALCREQAGDAQGAMEHDLAAIYLDAAFAMPHLHLGRMAKRMSDLTTARRELERAQTLLPGEDALRILLFGGGFNREALVAFSRAELRACRGGS